MKSKDKSLWLLGGVELLTWGEKGLEHLFTKAKDVKDTLIKKLNLKSKKATQKKQTKQQVSEKLKERDAEITTANYSIQKLENQRITKTRLQELEQDDSDKGIEKEHEQ